MANFKIKLAKTRIIFPQQNRIWKSGGDGEEKLRGYEAQIRRLKNKRQQEKAERLVEKLRRVLQRAGGLGERDERKRETADSCMNGWKKNPTLLESTGR